MIGAQMPQDILKYEAKFALGLTARKCVYYGLGVAAGLFGFFTLGASFSMNTRSIITCILCIPFFLWGTAKPFGENPEKVVIPFIIDNFLAPAVRVKEIHFSEYEKETAIYKAKRKTDRAAVSKEYKMIL